MKKLSCDAIAIPYGEKVETNSLVHRVVAAGDSVQCQSVYVSNVHELLSRLIAEGYQLPPVTEDREAHR